MQQLKEAMSFGGLRAWAKRATRRINALANIRIVRSGSTDTVTVSENGILINVRNMPSPIAGGVSSAGNPGLLIYRAGETTPDFIAAADILEDYDASEDDDWSIEFAVASSKLVAFSTTAPTFVSDTALYDGDVSADPVEAQTFYRIPVVRTIGGEKYTWNVTGIYRENIFCAGSKGAIVELIRIG